MRTLVADDPDFRAAFLSLAGEARHQHRFAPASADNAMTAASIKGRMLAERTTGMSVKWYSIMTMQMRGLTNIEIASRLGMSEVRISNICRTERYRAAYKARLDGLDEDLYALKPKAIDALSRGLTSTNTDTALRAASEFFKVSGQGTYGKQADGPSGSVGAEALAKQLLLAAKAEVHVHVHTQPEGLSQGGEAPSANHVLVEDAPSANHVLGGENG